MTRRRSQGSALVAVLMILLILMMGVSGFQYLSSSALRQYRQDFLFEDNQARADGILEMILSRWKYYAQFSASTVTWVDATASERGVWEGHEFVMGWYIESLGETYPADRVAFWVRFLDHPTARAYRYDLMLRMPFPFKPRMVEVMGCSIESMDPEDPGQRKASFEASAHKVVRPVESEARVETFSEAAEKIAAAGEPPEKLLPKTSAPAEPGLAPLLTQWRLLATTWQAQARRTVAAGLVGPSESMSRKWRDMARFELAQALITCGNWEIGATRQNYFQEARTQLEDILRPEGDEGCCGQPMVAWTLANLLVRMRAPLDDADEFKKAKAAAMQILNDLVKENPRRFVHERTDICVEELPLFFDTLWKARVAVGARAPNSLWVVTSMLEDGTKQLVHQEMWVTPTLLHWERDGGHWIMSTMDGDETASGEGIWRVPVFGTRPEMVFPDPLNVGAAPPIANIGLLHTSPDGGMFLSGTLDPEIGGKARDATWAPTGVETDPMLGEHETDLSTAHEVFTGTVFRIAIRGTTVHQVYAFEEDWYEPFVFSPDARRIAYLISPMEEGQTTDMVLVDSEKFWRGETPLTFPIGATEAEFDVTKLPPPIARLPVNWDAELSRISWKRVNGKEWISLASVLYVVDPGRMEVFWVDPDGAPGSNMFVQRQPPTRFFVSENGVSGSLVPSPPGLLTATADRILIIPVPGSPDGVKTLATDIPAGAYSTLGKVRAFPWGETAMFIGCTPDLYHDFFRVDLNSGRTEKMIGIDGKIPGVEDVWDYQISPIPERS